MARQIHTIGKLCIEYTAYGQQHTASVGLLIGADPGDFASMEAAAEDLVTGLQAIAPLAVSFSGFHTLDPFGRRLIAGAISPPERGTHGTSGEPWRSFTLTFSGKGQSDVDFGRNGNTRLVMHTYNAYQPTATLTDVPLTFDSGLGVLATTLTTSTVFWGDFYGVKASLRGHVLVQFNAYAQKDEGC